MSVCLSVARLWRRGTIITHRLEYFENNFTAINLGPSLSLDANIMSLLEREHLEILAGIGVGKGAFDVKNHISEIWNAQKYSNSAVILTE